MKTPSVHSKAQNNKTDTKNEPSKNKAFTTKKRAESSHAQSPLVMMHEFLSSAECGATAVEPCSPADIDDLADMLTARIEHCANKGIEETKVTVNAPDSPLHNLEVTLTKWDTAPMEFNVGFSGEASALNALAPHITTLSTTLNQKLSDIRCRVEPPRHPPFDPEKKKYKVHGSQKR